MLWENEKWLACFDFDRLLSESGEIATNKLKKDRQRSLEMESPI